MKHNFTIALALMLVAASSSAQTQGTRQTPPQMKTPVEMAKERADMMQAELSLDNKQYKKVYKLFKKDFEYRQQEHEGGFPGGMPPQGGGPGFGGPGMGHGMPGGGMPGGGMPPQMGGMQPGGHPEGASGMGPRNDVVTEEYLEKQDQKLRKILSPEQYDRWRAGHPAEHIDLPPIL